MRLQCNNSDIQFPKNKNSDLPNKLGWSLLCILKIRITCFAMEYRTHIMWLKFYSNDAYNNNQLFFIPRDIFYRLYLIL